MVGKQSQTISTCSEYHMALALLIFSLRELLPVQQAKGERNARVLK